jgi:hypothetical protein
MRLRSLYPLFVLLCVVVTTGCCCCPNWGERRCCRRVNRPCTTCGNVSCSGCTVSGYTPACDCGAAAGPQFIAPTPVTGPMPKATTMTLSR